MNLKTFKNNLKNMANNNFNCWAYDWRDLNIDKKKVKKFLKVCPFISKVDYMKKGFVVYF